MTTSSAIETLFSDAIVDLDAEEPPSRALTGWSAITQLHRLASAEVLHAALAACEAAAPQTRRVGAAVLGQLGHSRVGYEPVFRDERYAGLAHLLDAETRGPADPRVLADACIALGHLHDPRAIPALLDLRTSPDADIRYAVAFGLSGFDHPQAIGALVELSSDTDETVRDWATFALAHEAGSDSPAIRQALRARLNDSSYDIRNEAIAGLAKLKDEAAASALKRELMNGVSIPLLEAAIELARPDLCEALDAAAARGLTFGTSNGSLDLNSLWKEAATVCGCLSDHPNS
ncbi:MAG: HEAT repeat domain-containing protein [Rhodoblastus sp.]